MHSLIKSVKTFPIIEWNCFLYVVSVYKIHRVDQMQHYHFSRVDQVGIDQMGIDQMGVDQMGVDQVGMNLKTILVKMVLRPS